MTKTYDWILAAAGTEFPSISITIVKNSSIGDIKKQLVECVKEVKETGGTWDSGTLKIKDVEERPGIDDELASLYAEANFTDYHCNFEAYIMDKVAVEEY